MKNRKITATCKVIITSPNKRLLTTSLQNFLLSKKIQFGVFYFCKLVKPSRHSSCVYTMQCHTQYTECLSSFRSSLTVLWNAPGVRGTYNVSGRFKAMRSESPRGKCAKLDTVATGNKQQCRSLLYCLFAPHTYGCYFSRTSCLWWIAHSTSRCPIDCNKPNREIAQWHGKHFLQTEIKT